MKIIMAFYPLCHYPLPPLIFWVIARDVSLHCSVQYRNVLSFLVTTMRINCPVRWPLCRVQNTMPPMELFMHFYFRTLVKFNRTNRISFKAGFLKNDDSRLSSYNETDKFK